MGNVMPKSGDWHVFLNLQVLRALIMALIIASLAILLVAFCILVTYAIASICKKVKGQNEKCFVDQRDTSLRSPLIPPPEYSAQVQDQHHDYF